MLVASLYGNRVEAEDAERHPDYSCPNCRQNVILKRGRIRVAHFAHKPPTNCTWAGETTEHLNAKKYFKDTFVRQGLVAEVEYPVASLHGDRRTDVMLWLHTGVQVALELQHTSISLDEIEARAATYAKEGIAQAWIPFLTKAAMAKAERVRGELVIKKYTAKPFEKWAQALHFKNLWFWDPTISQLWQGTLETHELYVESTTWYESGGEERHAGGYTKPSKRWRDLYLKGPFRLEQLQLTAKRRQAWRTPRYNVPAGLIAQFSPK